MVDKGKQEAFGLNKHNSSLDFIKEKYGNSWVDFYPSSNMPISTGKLIDIIDSDIILSPYVKQEFEEKNGIIYLSKNIIHEPSTIKNISLFNLTIEHTSLEKVKLACEYFNKNEYERELYKRKIKDNESKILKNIGKWRKLNFIGTDEMYIGRVKNIEIINDDGLVTFNPYLTNIYDKERKSNLYCLLEKELSIPFNIKRSFFKYATKEEIEFDLKRYNKKIENEMENE